MKLNPEFSKQNSKYESNFLKKKERKKFKFYETSVLLYTSFLLLENESSKLVEI